MIAFEKPGIIVYIIRNYRILKKKKRSWILPN